MIYMIPDVPIPYVRIFNIYCSNKHHPTKSVKEIPEHYVMGTNSVLCTFCFVLSYITRQKKKFKDDPGQITENNKTRKLLSLAENQ